ncbi:hypothetical protein T4B_7128 [Trichinella pseudospiralis]|uniref:Uncharacterized protein n=1 Tax=Trichinella pseudospiralis TaxID=6337 RepID=A0A0V1JG34_TRIPS|nr:hypothetical protein T4A_5927 [Trichinella pseudospiralis]KRZ33975.1 hypothetical protein T4B_7128 [Trichinella pseudospiralis]KRZ42709.1 hypothetical protein T4C_12106 [Trichinella pseudospiralis]
MTRTTAVEQLACNRCPHVLSRVIENLPQILLKHSTSIRMRSKFRKFQCTIKVISFETVLIKINPFNAKQNINWEQKALYEEKPAVYITIDKKALLNKKRNYTPKQSQMHFNYHNRIDKNCP